MTQGTAIIGRDQYRTQIEVGNGHQFVSDEPPSLGGGDVGPAPYDLVIGGLGACTAITLRMYADHKQWPLESVQVQLRLTREDEAMIVYRTLLIKGLDDAQKSTLADVAERTPVTLTLKSGLQIRTSLV